MTEQKRGVPAPAVSGTPQEVIAAGEEALERIKRPTFHVQPDEVVHHDPSAETLRSNQYRSGGWLHGPAMLRLFANTDRRLTKIANQLGDPGNAVERVEALRVKGTKLVYIWPTDKEEANGIEVKRYDSSAWINLITLLGPANMTVETNYKQRYEINYAKPEDHVYPALKIDLGRVMERRREGDSKSGEGEGGPSVDTAAGVEETTADE